MKTINTLFFLLFFLIGLIACGGSGDNNDGPERNLDISSDHLEVITVDRYFSLFHFGPTLRMYYFKDQNTVLKANFPNNNADFEIEATINIFSDNEDQNAILNWISNQHSDVLTGAPEPIKTTSIETSDYEIISDTFIDVTVGEFGDEYDNYRLEFFIDNISLPGYFYLNNFNDNVIVHVRTKGATPPF